MNFRRFWVVSGLLLMIGWLPPGQLDSFIPCAVKSFLHVDCPGCGLLRSWSALLHGDVLASLQYYPLGPLLFVFLVVLATEPFWRLSRKVGYHKSRWPLWVERGSGLGMALILMQWAIKLSW